MGEKLNSFEAWKAEKHGFDVWPDLLRWAEEGTPHAAIAEEDLQRMKWYGLFWRKHDRDRYMIRIRIPGCEMTAEQARGVAFVAYEAGHGIVDVTTRGNVQVQGLPIERIPAVIAALERTSLTSKQTGLDNVRNVTSHPLSGVDPDELIDTRELARQITALFVGNRELSNLPRKFNIGLNGRPDSAPADWTQDISWLAVRRSGGLIGFRLLVGGTQGQNPHLGWHLPVFVVPERVVDVTQAILRVFNELGSRTDKRTQVRFRYLVDRIGADGVLEETEKRLRYALPRFPEAPPPPKAVESFIGWFPQKEPRRFAVGVAVPMGRLTWEQMEGLAILSRRHGDGTLRTATDQNLLLPNVAAEAREKLGNDLAALGLAFDADSLMRDTVACTGKQFCSLAVTDAKGYGFQLVEELRRRRVETFGIRIAISGCPNACAQHHTADIGLKGVRVRRGLRVVDAFDVYLGGGVSGGLRLGTLHKKGVPFAQLSECLENVIRRFHAERGAGETFSAFWQRRLAGEKPEVVADEELPLWRCEPCGYLHAGERPPGFCPHCAAVRARFVATDGAEATAAPDAAEAAPASTKVWRCLPCGYEHHGENPPEICPVCGAGRDDFKLVGDGEPKRAPVRVTPTGKRILIVGGSIAGHTAAHVCRELDPSARITIATDEKLRFYNRLNLTRFLASELEREKLFDFSESWYAEQQIEVVTESRAISVDPWSKRVVFASGIELAYDALILTHGSAAAVPKFLREIQGVHLLRTLEDTERILDAAKSGQRVAVIGGGVLGLEAAYGAKKCGGADVSVFEFFPRLMPRQLDATAGSLLAELVGEKGIAVHTGVGVRAIVGSERAQAVELDDGRAFGADLVVVSTGIAPNVDWVKCSGIDCGRGILVDDRMRTSAEDVYAAGDVVEWRGRIVGLWMNAIEQAKVAAANAVGAAAEFTGFVPATTLKCLGIPVFAVGDSCAEGDDVTAQVVSEPSRKIYWKLVSQGGLPIGGIVLNSGEGIAEMKRIVETTAEIGRVSKAVLAEPAPAAPALR
jgi:ferredoxin-nitrite reductase